MRAIDTSQWTDFKFFAIVEGVTFAALAIVAIAVAAYSAISSMLPNSILSPGDCAILGFAYTFTIGAPFALLFGGPIYWLLMRFNKFPGWPLVLALGVIPGLALFFVATDLGIISALCGVAVASITHLLCGKLALKRAFQYPTLPT